MPALPERSVTVSKLELFFDLVFVSTITQLTTVLADGHDLEAVVQVVVMLLLIWWIYDGYAWLTNAISTDLLRFRLLLLGGMGGFLIIALAIPDAYESTGLAFGIGCLVVMLLHGGIAVGLAVGTVLFILCDVGFRRTFGIERNKARLLAAPLLLAAIPLGTEAEAAIQIGALAAIVVVALVAESSPRRPHQA